MHNGKALSVLFSAQVVGIVFYVVVWLTYSLDLPSTDNLIGDPAFRLLLQVLGGFFLILIASALITIILVNKKSRKTE